MANKINKYHGTEILEILEGVDKYNSWISEQILKYSKPPILEFGAGTGNITQFVSKKTPYVVSEVDKELIKRLKKQYYQKKNVSVLSLDVTKIPCNKNLEKFNTVFSSNVLEHIQDDLSTLKNIKKLLKKDGRLILLVPAKQIAYGRLDKALGHYRRYEKNKLKVMVECAGYDVEQIYYFNMVGLLAWKIRDKVTKNNELKSGQVKLFDSIVPFLQFAENIIKPPVGISLIVVASKKQ